MMSMLKLPILRIPLFIFVILCGSSFVPIIHVIIMTLNGGFLSLFFGSSIEPSNTVLNYTNIGFGTVALFLFLYAQKIIWKSIWAVIYIFFVFPLFTYLLFGEDGFITDYYFLPILLSSFLSVIILFVLSLLLLLISNNK